MNQKLIENWNSVVSPEDTVYFLGDFAFTKNTEIEKVFNTLNGKKILIVGNHDPKQTLSLNWEYTAEYLELTDEGYNLVLSHYPFEQWNGKEKGSIHLHGHIHTTKETLYTEHRPVPNRWDVGVDLNDYTPMTIHEIVEKIRNFANESNGS